VRKFRRVKRDKKTNVPSKYLTGAKNKAAKAKEIKETAEKYKRGEYIDIKAINKSRSAQEGREHIYPLDLATYQWLHGQWAE